MIHAFACGTCARPTEIQFFGPVPKNHRDICPRCAIPDSERRKIERFKRELAADMRLKKKPKPGVCHANRCTAAEGLTVAEAGAELCPKHAGQEIEDPAPPPAASGELAPVALRAEVVQPLEVEALALRDQIVAAPPVIDGPERLEAVGALASFLQGRISTIEKERKSVTAHLVAAKRQIDGWFNPAKKALEECKTLCQNAISDYRLQQQQAQAKALASGDHQAAMAVAPAALPAGTHERKVWTFEITDPAAVPAEFLITSIDAAKVQSVVDAQRERTSIPGIRAFEKTTLVTRGS